MNTYLIVKHIHLTLVTISISLFVWRGTLMWRGKLPFAKLLRILPHLVDTLLLASGITLAALSALNPLTSPWLLAKLTAVVLYIVFGMIALKHGKTLTQRRIFLVLALFALAYIVLVAATKAPWIIR